MGGGSCRMYSRHQKKGSRSVPFRFATEKTGDFSIPFSFLPPIPSHSFLSMSPDVASCEDIIF